MTYTKRKPRKKIRTKRKTGFIRTDYKDKLWKVFSRYIRLRDNGTCFTCGVKKHYKEMQAGHFIHNVLDFDEMNINCQCARCNKFLQGAGATYAMRLLDKYGAEEFNELRKRAAKALGGERREEHEYKEMLENYTKLANELEENYVF